MEWQIAMTSLCFHSASGGVIHLLLSLLAGASAISVYLLMGANSITDSHACVLLAVLLVSYSFAPPYFF